MNKADQIDKLRNKLNKLEESPLYNYRIENNYYPVFGDGGLSAKIMLVGEAPGRNEAKLGKPFCGAAGKILDELLKSIKLKRENIYITNIVKDRPQDNRDPSPREIEIYGPFLDSEIEIIKPKVIVTLGRYAMDYIMNKFDLADRIEIISKAHGKIYKARGVDIVVLYHPCVAIYNRSKLKILKDDFKILKRY